MAWDAPSTTHRQTRSRTIHLKAGSYFTANWRESTNVRASPAICVRLTCPWNARNHAGSVATPTRSVGAQRRTPGAPAHSRCRGDGTWSGPGRRQTRGRPERAVTSAHRPNARKAHGSGADAGDAGGNPVMSCGFRPRILYAVGSNCFELQQTLEVVKRNLGHGRRLRTKGRTR